ncbi:MAG: O-antigen/teichoic acid export membrane protein [Planctomycetota bacterium]
MIKLIVLALRGFSIGARFLLSFLFIKHISLEFQGEYSLLITTITICTLISGLDFYVYANRFLIKNLDKANFALSNQFIFHLCTYCLLIVVYFSLYLLGVTHDYITITVLFLVIFEHLGMEFFRVYIALEKVLMANILLFLRTGVWPLILIYQLLFTETNISLNLVINYWVLSGMLSVLIGFIYINRTIKLSKPVFDKKWIVRGIKVGGLFFVATGAQKIIEFSDRFIIDAILGPKTLGVYSFYFQLSNLVNVVIFTIFFSFMYPKIIYYIDKREKRNAMAIIGKLKLYSVVVIVIYALFLIFLMPYVLKFMDKPELNEYQIVLYLFLAGNLFLNLSFTSHYALMAVEEDRRLMWIAIVVGVINISGNFVAVNYFGIIGAVCVFALSSALLYFAKGYAEKSYFKTYEW